jgi:hypothetical protein
MAAFTPTFDVGAWGASAKPATDVPKPKLDAFGVDEAFAANTAPFSTEVPRHELVLPEPVPPVDDITKTAAARIFTEFCER